MASITIFSAICHFSRRRSSDKLPVVGQASAIAVCFCIVCIKLFLVFLLSLEFWHYFFGYLLVGNMPVFLEVYYCLLSSELAKRTSQVLNNLLPCKLSHSSYYLDWQEEMLDIQGYWSSLGEQIMQIIKGAFPVRSVKNFVSSQNYGLLRSDQGG